ncbi:helix-turn-helix domain-containing protein [Shewanella sp. MBTL60-007]|uniref:helix-turn-helix domain-containing protein n=1 Tax=Shewanella sp. MBTL60-007 TaxID=2815911 RepID=UPI001BC26794|nr:helix-turn-helix transcriptional regulator [Shewanella sp. MBTL60-007]GIU22139.1 hypothetical protein TUM3792_23860 [Shewanella sp. MBTL60-007]
MEDRILIGQRIKSAREKQKLSQEQLGSLMGVSFQSVQQWESGKTTPRSARVRKLATVLKTTPNWIQFGMGTATSENLDDILKTVRSDEFRHQMCDAFAKTIQSSMNMGWINISKPDVSMAILADLYYSKVLEQYGLEPNGDKQTEQEPLQRADKS